MRLCLNVQLGEDNQQVAEENQQYLKRKQQEEGVEPKDVFSVAVFSADNL